MKVSLSVLERYINEEVAMLKRAEEMEVKGVQEDSKAISQEWEGASARDILLLNVDCFVR